MRWTHLIAIGLCAAAPILAQSSQTPQFGASISGRLLDPAGRPLANWKVQTGRWEYHQGRREFHLLPKSTATTSGTGEFTISPLDSGDYCIRASRPDHLITYFPGVNDILSATQIAVSTGRKMSGIDFRVRAAKRFHVRGRLIGAPGGLIVLRPKPMFDPEDAQHINTSPDGSFDLGGVLPGEYAISGYYQFVTAYTVVAVKDSDVDNIVVQMLPCAKIRGTVRVDGRPSAARLSLAALSEAVSYGVEVDRNGTLTSQCVVPGQYSLTIELARDDHIKSIRLDGKDVTDEPLDLTSRADKLLDVELGSQAGAVRGVIRDATDNRLPGITVTVWSSDRNFNSSAVTDTTGSFEIGHLPPGAYRVAAWDRLHSQPSGWGIQTMRAFRDEFNSEASPIVVKQGEQAALNPVLIPFRRIQETARKLDLNAVIMPDDQEPAIREAVKSPYTIATLISANPHIDESTLAKALNLDESDFSLPCNFSVSECSVKVEKIEPVSSPEMTLVVIQNDLPGVDVFLRYARKSGDAWRFTGAARTSAHYGAPTHEIVRMWGKPFLKTDSDWSQNGAGILDHVEEWFDLADAGFKPVFSFTSEGGTNGFAMAVSTMSESEARIGQAGPNEQIELTVKMHFAGPKFDVKRLFVGIHQRPANGKFKLVNAYSDRQHLHTIATQEFEALSNPLGDGEVNLLRYALAGLREIAAGPDADAREWLEMVLEHSRDSAEKREFLELLKKRR